jgi:hypothetical protein
MTRTSILIDQSLLLELKQLARSEGKTVTAVISEAIGEYLKERRSVRRLSFAAAGRSGKHNVSRDAEPILRRKSKPHEGW